MQRTFDTALGATVIRDDDQQVRAIQFRDAASNPLGGGAKSALRSVATWLGIPIEELGSLDQPVSYLEPVEQGVQFRVSDTKTSSTRQQMSIGRPFSIRRSGKRV